MIPRVLQLLRGGEYDDATQIYWQLHPARKAKAALVPALHGGAFINRQAWKFQGPRSIFAPSRVLRSCFSRRTNINTDGVHAQKKAR